MIMRNLRILLLWFVCCKVTYIICHPTAYIGGSQIEGRRVQHLHMKANQYLGIRYAKPPVGKLRFMKPEPVEGYPKVFRAIHQPPACHQYTQKLYPWYITSTEKSEDCLYLNIWTPIEASPQNTKAVFYWIHGGGFRYGSIRDPVYNGIPFAALGDIVLVAVNYRVGPLGYVTSNTKDAPGNAGLWDVLEGLKWVNQNILAFGGDPSRITIGGESAGAMTVALLNVSPLSRGLFCRQIMQSGSAASFEFENTTSNIDLSQVMSTQLNCASDTFTILNHPKEVIECLQGVDAAFLAQMDDVLFSKLPLGFQPQYPDEILPENPRLAIINGEIHGKELLSGVTKDEGGVVSTIFDDTFGFFGERNPLINKSTGQKMMEEIFASFPNPELVVHYFLNNTIKETDYERVRKRLFTSFGDMLLVCPTLFYAEKCAEIGNRVYEYRWVHRSSTSPWYPLTSVVHFTEIEFVFGRPVLYPELFEKDEVQISLQMIEMWSNFIKNGYPGFSWPLYTKENPVYKYIGPGTEIHNEGLGPHEKNCNFCRSIYGF